MFFADRCADASRPLAAQEKTALEDERGFDLDDGSDEYRLRAP
jgi:hypothetical protein